MKETLGTCTLHAIFPATVISLTQWPLPSVTTKLPLAIGKRPLGSPEDCGGLCTHVPVWPSCPLVAWPPAGIMMILQFAASGTSRPREGSISAPSGPFNWLGPDPGASALP